MKHIKIPPMLSLCKMLVFLFFFLRVSSTMWGFVYSHTRYNYPAGSTNNVVHKMLSQIKNVLACQATTITNNEDISALPRSTKTLSPLVHIAKTYKTSEPSKERLLPLPSKKTAPTSPGPVKRFQILLVSGILLIIGTIFLPAFFPQFHQPTRKVFRGSEKPPSQTSASLLSYSGHLPSINFEFCGREAILSILSDAVSHLQHIGLFGLPKIGKTSLLWQLRNRPSQHIVVYMDLQQVPSELSGIYHAIFTACLREAAYKYPDVSLTKFNQERPVNGNVQFCQRLVSLWEALREKTPDLKIVLLFDEADHLCSSGQEAYPAFSVYQRLMDTIRKISQQYGFLVSLVAASRPDIFLKAIGKGQNHPGGQYYKELFLSTLSEEECNQMILSLGKQMGLHYTEESLSRLYYETSGHPYVTRQLCTLIMQHIFPLPGYHQREVSIPDHASLAPEMTVEVKDVVHAVSAYLEYKADYLESIWQSLSSLEQEMLQIVMMHESCTLDVLMGDSHRDQNKREQRKAISSLLANELIEKCENKYSLKMGIFERYLSMTK